MNIAYECKFCNRPGIVIMEESPGIQFQIEKWKPILCCNRCGDFMVAKRKITDLIQRNAACLNVCRITLQGEKLLKAESMCREAFTKLTKQFATVVCDYFRKTNVWDQEFVNMLMDKPDRFWHLCNQYMKLARTV